MNAFLETLQGSKPALIMSMPVNDADLVDEAFRAGADAVKVHVNLRHRASERQFGDVSEYKDVFEKMFRNRRGPLGVVPGNDPAAVSLTVRDTLRYPFDFLSLYAHHAPADVLGLPPARMLACDGGYDMDEVAAFAEAGADVLEASIIPGAEYGQPLQLRDLMRYRVLCQRSGLPVVVPTQRAIRPEDVRALADTGIRGLMIGAIVTGTTRESILQAIAAYRAAIDRL